MRACRAVAVAVTLVSAAASRADTFAVYPGPQAVTKAIAAARPGPGDVVRLHAGRYEETINVPGGVTLEEFGDGNAVIVGGESPCVRVTAANVTIRGLVFEAGAEAGRGIDSMHPVRIERCTFRNLPEAIALMKAPLSDVVSCDFVDCSIGVRAIGAASPTVWGCRFTGGGTGVTAIDGGPYVRNNLFVGLETGMLLVSRNPHTMIVRNNVFVDCTKSAIEVKGGDFPLAFTSVRNCIFARCGAVMTGPSGFVGGISHCAVDDCGDEPFPVTGGHPPDRSSWALVEGPLGLSVNDAGSITIEHGDALDGAGIREPTEPAGTPGHIGLPPPFMRPGPTLASPLMPPVRLTARPLIANAVSEQYLYMGMLGVRTRGQSLRNDEEAGMVDAHRVDGGGEIVFSVARFFGETSAMTP
jgi:hypothetical protein